MKTTRFTNVVAKAGDPEAHLVLTKPDQDAELRKAIKQQRVMTVFQEAVGQKTDRGKVGFEPGINRQFLIFPKSLHSFEAKEIVGIKYDLLKVKEIPKSQRAVLRKPLVKKQKSPKHEEKLEPPKPDVEEAQPKSKTDESVASIKKQIRHAMKLLEEGKAVAASNLLNEIVEED